ncbi:ABC transporter permease [Alkaliphilus sp. MSJ-5]|uniref:ABC transporter permease n=1 Tax=Alkaliphilus flagellatus TaxID=2841507 RepID=A0ABS6FYC8_9FIRM|nr:ABC transporter permease [Alkaliphilus flagellatus]MBU5675245.1 ABC transporter permease [Alkaliphilus flagellatus]
MLKLIRLELRRNKLTGYKVASGCIFLGILALCFLFAFMPAIVESQGDILSAKELAMFSGWNNLIAMMSTISMTSFAVLSTVMHARFIVTEYTGKRAILLFSYPIKRSRILWAKCSLVFWFTTGMMFLCNLAAITLFGICSNLFQILSEPFTITTFTYLLTTTLILSLLSGAIGLIALRIGFWKKSVPITIVSAVILASPCSQLFSFFLDSSITVMLATMLLLLTIGFVIFLGLTRMVNRMEVL